MFIETVTLISAGAWTFSKVTEKGIDHLIDKSITQDEFDEAFYEAVSETADLLQTKYPDILGDSIDYFFKKEEVFNELYKLLFVDAKINTVIIENNFDVSTLPVNFIEEFISSLETNIRRKPILSKIFTNNKIYIAIQDVSTNIEKIAKSSNLTFDQVNSIRGILEKRVGVNFDLKKFVYNYSNNAINNLSQVNYIGLGIDASIKRNRKKLEDIYIRPNFGINKSDLNKVKTARNDIDPDDENIITYEKLFSLGIKNFVVLGDPGSGKSTLVKSMVCDILKEGSEVFVNRMIKTFLAFRIELRKYLVFKNQFRGNIIKYLTSLLNEEYGIGSINEKILDDIFRNQRIVIFFDGLDEIFKRKDKIAIKNDIENFHTVYNDIYSFTTSRKVGYEEAKLKDDFLELHIQNFSPSQIKKYVRKWYSIEEEIEDTREKEIEGFLERKNEIDSELLQNPLLLSLIVILYRNLLKLPESRLEIYQSCTRTLVDKWDASKELVINIDEKILKNKEKILADLSYWLYRQMSSEYVEITHDKALTRIIHDKNHIWGANVLFLRYLQTKKTH
jgi:energy-coupling factor transporter ATP-binding protein EcfA2